MSDHEAEPTRRRLTDILGRDGLKQFLGLLSEGKPVEVSAIAQASGLEPDLLRSELRAQPGTDWDENGRLVGFGLTLRETPHRFVVSGRTLFTWCAIDTLIFPVLMGIGSVPDGRDSRPSFAGLRPRALLRISRRRFEVAIAAPKRPSAPGRGCAGRVPSVLHLVKDRRIFKAPKGGREWQYPRAGGDHVC